VFRERERRDFEFWGSRGGCGEGGEQATGGRGKVFSAKVGSTSAVGVHSRGGTEDHPGATKTCHGHPRASVETGKSFPPPP